MVISFSPWSRRREGFELGPKRRWRHSEAYLRDSPVTAGFTVAGLVAAAPRHEAGQPVPEASPSPCPGRPNKRHFSALLCVASRARAGFPAMVALDNHAFSGPGRGPELTLGAVGGRHRHRWRSCWCWARSWRAAFPKTASAWAASWPGAMPLWFSSPPWWRGRSAASRRAFFPPSPARKPQPQAGLGLLRQLWRLSAVGVPAQCDSPSAGATLMSAVRQRRGAGDGGRRPRRLSAWAASPSCPTRSAGCCWARGDLFLALLFPDGAGADFRPAPSRCFLRHQPEPDVWRCCCVMPIAGWRSAMRRPLSPA